MNDLEYYARAAALTRLPAPLRAAGALPTRLPDLCKLVQGSLVHPFMGGMYGLDPAKLPLADLQLRSAAEIAARVCAHDPRPFGVPREPARRFCGNCRHHTVLVCGLLRAQGVPARARCGFAAYFQPGFFVDHWVAEVWSEERGAWHLVDAQLDAAQRAAFRIGFDPLDVPRSAFLVAGEAWRRVRAGEADADRFGVLDMAGLWFVAGNVVRDLAALRKRELLPWDAWGLMRGPNDVFSEADLELLDRAGAVGLAPDERGAELRALARHPALRVPARVRNVQTGREEALPR